LKIDLFNNQKDLPIDKSRLRLLVREVLSFLEISPKELAIYFVEEKKISELHEQFFQDPTVTDCITFPIDEEFLGEIFVCPKVALTYAKKRGLDPQKEVLLYVIHGILHLIGYDDLDPKERRSMRKMEKSCMRHLEQL
jgi:probable rRNA maturation factor